MSELRYDDWMSETDAVLWHIERDPLLRSTITSTLLFDGPLDREALDPVIAKLAREVPRLRQRVIEAPGQLTTPKWEADPHFDLAYHYQWVRLHGDAPTRRDLFDHAQHMASRAFDRQRPLWELTVVDGGPDAGTALVVKAHHVIADGLGMVQILGHLVEFEAGVSAMPTATAVDDDGQPTRSVRTGVPGSGLSAFAHRLGSDVQSGFQFGRAALGVAKGMLTHPFETGHDAEELVESIGRVVKPASTRLSKLLTGRSMSPRFDTLAVPLADLKAAAKTVGGTINTGFVSAVLAGLDAYHREMGVETAEVRMNMPISVRGGGRADEMGNQFVPARFVLPLGRMAPAERMSRTAELLAKTTGEPALPYVDTISGAIGRMGPAATVNIIGSMMHGVDVVTSNVPGPPVPVWVAGSLVDEFYAFGPLAGAAINLTLFSYDGTLHVGVNTDQAAVTEPQRFVACLEAGFGEMIDLASSN